MNDPCLMALGGADALDLRLTPKASAESQCSCLLACLYTEQLLSCLLAVGAARGDGFDKWKQFKWICTDLRRHTNQFLERQIFSLKLHL